MDYNGLRESFITESTNPQPLFISEVMVNTSIFPEYLPSDPGVYSCILEIIDQANNSEYVRRVVIYDDSSDITVNTSHRFYVSSANTFTDYLWQTEYNLNSVSDVRVTWEGLFANSLHTEEHFLSNVLDYEPRLSDNIRRHNYKRILDEYDDNEGKRTINSIQNIQGVVKFEIYNEIVDSEKNESPQNGWVEISPIAENSSLQMASGVLYDGVIQQIWIRAFDIMNNSKTQSTVIHFDQTGPEHFLTSVDYNIVGGRHTFTSR